MADCASGGECGPGALSAAAGAGVAPVALQANLIGGTAISGLVGGLASVAGGGKFEDGAVTAAFGYLFNACVHAEACTQAEILSGAEGGIQDTISPLDFIGAAPYAIGKIFAFFAVEAGAEIAGIPTALARVIPGGISPSTLGAPTAADVFVTTPEAIEGLDAAGIAQGWASRRVRQASRYSNSRRRRRDWLRRFSERIRASLGVALRLEVPENTLSRMVPYPQRNNHDGAVMDIKPSETVLTGQSILQGGRVVADDVSKRIHALTSSYLVEVGRDASGWNTLYRDPNDGRYWELTYPQSELHGGGPPQLKCLSVDEARRKYGAQIVKS